MVTDFLLAWEVWELLFENPLHSSWQWYEMCICYVNFVQLSAWGYANLMSPNKDKTAPLADLSVRMRKALAFPWVKPRRLFSETNVSDTFNVDLTHL